MIADSPTQPRYTPRSTARRPSAFHALDRLVLRELEQVEVHTRRAEAAVRTEHDDGPVPAERATALPEVLTVASLVIPPAAALDPAAARFVKRATAWLAGRADASTVLDALARAIAHEGAPQAAEAAAADASAPAPAATPA